MQHGDWGISGGKKGLEYGMFGVGSFWVQSVLAAGVAARTCLSEKFKSGDRVVFSPRRRGASASTLLCRGCEIEFVSPRSWMADARAPCLMADDFDHGCGILGRDREDRASTDFNYALGMVSPIRPRGSEFSEWDVLNFRSRFILTQVAGKCGFHPARDARSGISVAYEISRPEPGAVCYLMFLMVVLIR